MYRLSILLACPLLTLFACDLGKYDGVVPLPPPPVTEPPPNADPQVGCASSCHGDADSAAPPKDTTGGTDPTLVSVGAHRAHLEVAPTWYRQGQCEDCHLVPAGLNDPGHIDTELPAELIFGVVASSGGVTAAWNGDGCTVYCHGASMEGGLLPEPGWTAVGTFNGQCDSCHGNPPPPPHPAGQNCGQCHPTMQAGGTTFLDPASHIDGKVDTAIDGENAQGCVACHGSVDDEVSAPPTDLDGLDDPTLASVGAHRAHLGVSDWHRELYCSQCHLVPADINAPGHMDDGDDVAEVIFDALNPDAAYDFGTATCTNMYCHSNGYSQVATAVWNEDLFLGCTGCHDDGTQTGDNMSGDHYLHIQEGLRCNSCHGQVVNQQNQVIGAEYHINGLHEIQMVPGQWDAGAQRCTNLACHGDENW